MLSKATMFAISFSSKKMLAIAYCLCVLQYNFQLCSYLVQFLYKQAISSILMSPLGFTLVIIFGIYMVWAWVWSIIPMYAH